MPVTPYIERLREAVGHQLLLLPGVAAIIRDEAGAILFQRRTDDGSWSLPAGAIDPGESPADAIRREVREETGLEVDVERVLGVFGGKPFRHTYPNGDETEYTVVVFACRVTGGHLQGQDDESAELRYFPPEKMPSLDAPYPSELFQDSERREALFE